MVEFVGLIKGLLLLALYIGAASTEVTVILKIADLVPWSWLWVLAPLWIPVTADLAFFGISWVILMSILSWAEKKQLKREMEE